MTDKPTEAPSAAPNWKDEAREFMEKAGIDPDLFDWDIPQLMVDFARIKVGEASLYVRRQS